MKTIELKNLFNLNCTRKFDYENYLATLFIKNDLIRKTAFTLRAFNVELSLVRDMAKTDQMAHLRFQFWNSIVQEIYSDNFEPKIFAKKYDNIPLALGLSDVSYQIINDLSHFYFEYFD